MNAPRNQDCPVNEQAVGWALHALEPDEEMAVLLHLPQCPSCRTAVADAEQVLANLGASVEQVAPPTSLRSGLLAAAADTPQRRAMLSPRVSPESVTPPPAPRHRAQGERPVPLGPPPRPSEPKASRPSWLSRRGRRLAAASLALIGVLSVGGLAVRTAQLEQQRDAETSQAQSIAELVGQLDRPGAQHALLASPEGSTVAAVLVADGQRQVFTVGLPANATDRTTYVLWGIRTGASPQPVGTFDVAAADNGMRIVGPAAPTDGFTSYAISIEPGRTAPTTPTTQVASGEVQA